MALKLDRKVYAAFVAGVFAVSGVNVAWDNATAKQETKTVIRKYIRTTDSMVQLENYFRFSHFQRVKVPIKDTTGAVVDTLNSYTPAEVVYRPLYYTVPANVFRVEVKDTLTDSIWYVAYIQSDSTGLLDVTARIQPSAPPVGD